MAVKDYLSTENARNKRNAHLYAKIMKLAFGRDDDVSIGHHLSFEPHGDIDDLNEIPAADTLIFDHDIMLKIFGDGAVEVMRDLASAPVDGNKRDELLESYLSHALEAQLSKTIESVEIVNLGTFRS